MYHLFQILAHGNIPKDSIDVYLLDTYYNEIYIINHLYCLFDYIDIFLSHQAL